MATKVETLDYVSLHFTESSDGFDAEEFTLFLNAFTYVYGAALRAVVDTGSGILFLEPKIQERLDRPLESMDELARLCKKTCEHLDIAASQYVREELLGCDRGVITESPTLSYSATQIMNRSYDNRISIFDHRKLASSYHKLTITSINYNSPLKVSLKGSLSVLVVVVALSGGEIDLIGGKAKLNGIVDATIKLLNCIYSLESIDKAHEIEKQQNEDDIRLIKRYRDSG
ncbi:hypothetical protein EUZ85_19365 [Hahella sp. KA22]|uniref:hypothetical protein n=1 Tax=Hahella sp. KA22 TaxID=1628392 RepID=UPI000FDF34D5|nr:hypothetical protein [Hahella sp. KA22]AZZ92764.1 hypothetical protein ENC22_16785 [Hahella sp. KA22]QAY56138.1 hypothetical protein EUZ85_19365 [Hahella sp. KA22]